MQKVKKICIRITPGRTVGTILMAASAVNLIIVGTAFEVAFPSRPSTVTSVLTTPPSTMTFLVPTSTAGEIFTFTLTPGAIPSYTSTSTGTSTQTPSATSTDTTTPTNTPTPSPSPVVCTPRYSWPIYFVQSGDTLFSLARATGTSVEGLMLANCLSNYYLYVGQLLYVPLLPINTSTPSITSTFTPSPTPVFTLTGTSTSASSACIEFEDLKLGTTYKVGEKFISSGVGLAVEPFAWGNGTPTSDGIAYVSDLRAAGGFGMELQVNNVDLIFDLGTLPSSLSLLFGEYGGNLNININGDFRNFENFADLDGSVVGGAKVAVLNGFGNDAGYLQLSGKIKLFLVGGQELWIDNVCLKT